MTKPWVPKQTGRGVAMVALVVVGLSVTTSLTSQAKAVPLGQQQAQSAVAALMRQAPQAASRPGETPSAVAGTSVVTPDGVVVKAAGTGCAAQAAQLTAGKIASYRCTQPTLKVVASKPQANRASVAWPSACSSGSGTLTGWVAVDRRNACDHVEIDLVTVLQPSGKVIGTTDLHAVSTMVASTTRARWASSTYLWLWSFTGVGAPETADGLLFPSCSTSSCLGSGGTWTPLSDGESWRGTGNVDVTLAKGVVDGKVAGFWEYTLYSKGWGNPVTVSNSLALSRCDNATAGTTVPGCVFSNIPATLAFSQKTVPDFVQHIYGAQLSGLPGRLGTGTYLTRLTDAALALKNGTRACPTSLKRPVGKQCDEYPFRSTYQGAYTSGATQARSLPWCKMPDPQRTGSKGWSRCFIPSGQNSSAGGTTGGFYRQQRMLPHDKFQIGYLP